MCVWVYNGRCQQSRSETGCRVNCRCHAKFRARVSLFWQWVDCRQLWARWRGRKVGGVRGGGGEGGGGFIPHQKTANSEGVQ